MIIKFLDTKTGEKAWSDYPFGIYWWAEGNGACDCNRAALFEGHEQNCGDRDYRYQAVDVIDHADKTIQQQLDEENMDRWEHSKLKTKEDILNAINNRLY